MIERKNHIRLFSVIAPFYNMAFRSQLENYRRLLKENYWRLDDKIERAIDIGCGTGAFARALSELGIKVTAVDASSNMVRIARRNLAGTGVRVMRADFFEDLPFEDNSFDLLVASYVLHGHKIDGRVRFYEETKRICKKEMILHEFFPNKNLLVSFVEFLERSDYRNFVSTAYEELKSFYPVVDRVRLSATSGWYICHCE
jgi:ubiquinone/menaquinone biosynthesis C-methylase UbiE